MKDPEDQVRKIIREEFMRGVLVVYSYTA